MIVVDASVATKWFIHEEGSAEALALLESGEALIAPELVRVEVTSAIIRVFLEDKLSETETRRALANLENVLRLETLATVPDEECSEGAILLCFSVRHAFADCLYLAVAQKMKCAVITADDTMQKRGIKAGIQARMLDASAAGGS